MTHRAGDQGPEADHGADGPLPRLLHALDLERLDRGLFLGVTGRGKRRLFGGLVAAQAVVAAGRTVSEGRLHALHAFFLRPGRHGPPIQYLVDDIRDGRTFTTRRVVATQGGEAIFNMSASFTRPEDGIAHQDPMPEAPPPEGLVDWEDLRAELLGDPSRRRPDGPVEVRECNPELGSLGPARRSVWMRVRGTLPEDPLLHSALLVFASDRTLLGTGARPHTIPWGRRLAASLDHAMWIHRPATFDGWILYTSESPAAHSGRALAFGAMYTHDGVRVASVAQEGIIRVLEK